MNESITEVCVLVPNRDAEAWPDKRVNQVMDLLVGVIEQDFAIGEGIQRNFEAGITPEVMYGRYEPALRVAQ